jgi:hypothetical protein
MKLARNSEGLFSWIPACAGMTERLVSVATLSARCYGQLRINSARLRREFHTQAEFEFGGGDWLS